MAGSRPDALAQQSGSASASVEGMEPPAGGAQRERSVTCLVGAGLLPLLVARYFRMWAVLKGVGELSERAWRKRLDQSRAWIGWRLRELLAVHQTPGWLPEGEGRVLLIDATRFKTRACTGDEVRLHQSYEVRSGRMEQVHLTDRHQAEGLSHFQLQPGDVVVTDAGYPVDGSVERTRALPELSAATHGGQPVASGG